MPGGDLTRCQSVIFNNTTVLHILSHKGIFKNYLLVLLKCEREQCNCMLHTKLLKYGFVMLCTIYLRSCNDKLILILILRCLIIKISDYLNALLVTKISYYQNVCFLNVHCQNVLYSYVWQLFAIQKYNV